jgi:hypothetical protein
VGDAESDAPGRGGDKRDLPLDPEVHRRMLVPLESANGVASRDCGTPER